MDLLIIEPLEAEVMQWLESRYFVQFAPGLASDPLQFRKRLHKVRALVVPPAVTIDASVLKDAPLLRAIGRVSAGVEDIDFNACRRAGVEVVRGLAATAQAEAEFMVGALISLLRRVPVAGTDGSLVGRELGGLTVGLIGLAPAAKLMVKMLAAFGSRVIAYDPALHATDRLFSRLNIEPVGLRELLERADAVCVQLSYYSRYQGLLGYRLLPFCKQDQVIVSITHSALFDEVSLAEALRSGRVSAAWLDSVEPGLLDEGRPLHGIENLQATPRVASTTRESRLRSSWAVARRIDEVLSASSYVAQAFRETVPDGSIDLATLPVLR